MFNSIGTAATAAEGKRNNNGVGFVIDARGGIVDISTAEETGATTVNDTLFGNGGCPISLQSRGPTKIASDYYTHDELLLLNYDTNNKDAATGVLEKENKRNLKIVHKLRTKEEKRLAKANKRQKMKRHARRIVYDNSSDDDNDDNVSGKKSKKEESLVEREGDDGGVASNNSLLSSLEATAVGMDVSLAKRGASTKGR